MGYQKINVDGGRIQIVGVVEDGKYTANVAEDPRNAVFCPSSRVRALTPGLWCARTATRGNWPTPFVANCSISIPDCLPLFRRGVKR